MKVCLTIDVEQDCPPYLTGYRGIETGLPLLLDFLRKEKIPGTFFVTGDVARRYPHGIAEIVAQGHELGCHGLTHQRFDRMNFEEAKQEIQEATQVLRKFYPVISFRAPNLQFPRRFLPLLVEGGYSLDSSLAKYKIAYYWPRSNRNGLKRIPVSITSSWLRLPHKIRNAILSRLKNPIVLFVHPWEFVDLTGEKIRWDCRVKTGLPALQCLRETLRFFKKRGGRFLKMIDLMDSE